MCAAQRNDLTVIEAHAAEDGAEMGLLFRTVGETSVGSAHGHISVGSARPPWDYGTLHFLDGADAGEGPQIGVGDPGELFCVQHHQLVGKTCSAFSRVPTLDGFKEVSSCFESGVGAMVSFRSKSHGGTIRTTGIRKFVVAEQVSQHTECHAP